jgi:hypothetical protein
MWRTKKQKQLWSRKNTWKAFAGIKAGVFMMEDMDIGNGLTKYLGHMLGRI